MHEQVVIERVHKAGRLFESPEAGCWACYYPCRHLGNAGDIASAIACPQQDNHIQVDLVNLTVVKPHANALRAGCMPRKADLFHRKLKGRLIPVKYSRSREPQINLAKGVCMRFHAYKCQFYRK